jgi:hypothetical protein
MLDSVQFLYKLEKTMISFKQTSAPKHTPAKPELLELSATELARRIREGKRHPWRPSKPIFSGVNRPIPASMPL